MEPFATSARHLSLMPGIATAKSVKGSVVRRWWLGSQSREQGFSTPRENPMNLPLHLEADATFARPAGHS